jgi:hypothetical protein
VGKTSEKREKKRRKGWKLRSPSSIKPHTCSRADSWKLTQLEKQTKWSLLWQLQKRVLSVITTEYEIRRAHTLSDEVAKKIGYCMIFLDHRIYWLYLNLRLVGCMWEAWTAWPNANKLFWTLCSCIRLYPVSGVSGRSGSRESGFPGATNQLVIFHVIGCLTGHA